MIHAYRKPLSDTFVLEVEGAEDATALHRALFAAGVTGERAAQDEALMDDLSHHLNAFLDGDEMPPPTEEDGGYFSVRTITGEGWDVAGGGTILGYTFRRESVAREAAATLNALVEVDNKV